MIFFVALLVFANMVYGIVKISKDKNLQVLEKAVWLIFVISMPVLGTALYLRSTFPPHRRVW
jgi:hypothetical protein